MGLKSRTALPAIWCFIVLMLSSCAVTNSFKTQKDDALSRTATQVVLDGLGIEEFSQACGEAEWACKISEVGAENDSVGFVKSTVSESRWAPASCGARLVLELLRNDPQTQSITVVKYENDSGTVLDTADKLTYRIGDCSLPSKGAR